MSHHLSWLESGVIGALQGVSELFPVSSLGHSVLLPAVVGGSWQRDMSVAAPESPYLAFIVGTHVATALALLVYYRRDWLRLIRGLFSSVRSRRIETADERLIWMLMAATVPVGLVGLLFEHWLRTHLGRPVPAAVFLMVNGVVLVVIERLTRRQRAGAPAPEEPVDDLRQSLASDGRLATMSMRRAVAIGAMQIAALAPGVSRSGVATAAGMRAGLSRDDAVRYAFLLATPVILAAGVLKIPDLFTRLGDGVRPQILFGSVLAGIGAYVSVRFLVKYVHTRTLTPFGVYCLLAGAGCLLWFWLR